MRSHVLCVTICLAAGAFAASARAQGPASFDDGRRAYDAGLYEKARDLLVSASKVAPGNAEVFLHLGKAHYQLGELPEAIAAWQKTLQLAPGEPYATKMLQQLRGEARDADVRLALVEQALAEKLHAWAAKALDELLADRSLSDAQRGRALALRAEVLLATGRHQDVPAIVVELQARYPKAADAAQLSLLMGRAKLRMPGESVAEGLALLRDVAAKQKGKPAGAWAEYELIGFDLSRQTTAKSVGELAAWVKANAQHAMAAAALGRLVEAHLALTRLGPVAQADSPLSDSDLAAISYVKELRGRMAREEDRLRLLQQVDQHFQSHYDAAGAFAAAIQGGEALRKLDLSLTEAAFVAQRIFDRQLALSRAQDRPTKDAELSATVLAAVERANELCVLLPKDADVQKVMQQLLDHVQGKYVGAGAYAAAFQAGEALRKGPLPRAAAAMVLQRLMDWNLALTRSGGRPAVDAPLAESDTRALALMKELVALVDDGEATRLADVLLKHADAHYRQAGAFAAAAQAAAAVRQLPLPPGALLGAARAVAAHRLELALRELTRQAEAGTLGQQMPQAVRDVLALYAAIEKDFLGADVASEQVALAQRLTALLAKAPDPLKVTALRAPDAWAAEIALAVVKATAPRGDPAAAIALVDTIRKRYQPLAAPEGFRIATELQERLIGALPGDHARRPAALMEQVGLLEQWAIWQFAENVRTGRDAENAVLGEPQKRMIAILAELARQDVKAHAGAALTRLTGHLRAWEQRGHYAAVEQALDMLAAALDEARKREALLATAELWIRQVVTAHQLLAAEGLHVPEKLDPMLTKALRRCCELQGDLEEGDAFLKKVRDVWQGVVSHHTVLGYHATAAEAIQVKAEKPAPAAERFAELALAHHRYAEATRELGRMLRQYNAKTKLGMTPAFQAALEAYRAFITRHAASPLADEAVARTFGVAQTFETQEAYTTAAAVYDEFAGFAAKVERLSQAGPGQVSTAERAALAAAGALHAHARKVLAKALAERKDPTPPAQVLAEFTTALNAYQQFVKDRPGSALAGEAVRQVMAAALEYARVDAWDVAEGIFADLQKAQLQLDSPERIELCRGLCHLGKVMGDHARQVLQALVEGHGRKAGGGAAALAYQDQDDARGGKGDGKKPADRPGADSGAAEAPAAGPVPKPTAPPPAAEPVDEVGKLVGSLAHSREEAESFKRKGDEADMLAMAAIRETQARRAREVAMLREKLSYNQPAAQLEGQTKQQGQQQAVPVLSDAELERQAKAFDAAYAILQAIRKDYALRPAAEQARGEILVMLEHWRAIGQWKRAAGLAGRFLQDNPSDRELAQLRLGIARDTLAWASQPAKEEGTKQQKLAEVTARFAEARAELERIVKDFVEDRALAQQAQWDIATSFLTQARVVDAFSPTLARGQYVRAARELQAVAREYHDHPRIAEVPQMLWNIADELARRSYFDEAMIVWNDLTIHHLTHPLAQQAALRIAQTYDSNLGRPLRAAEAYLEINFARGGDANVQNAIYAIGQRLKDEKRWVEALHVLETFVDSFPQHGQAGQALAVLGQIHQVNEAWEDAIAAYQRVIDEYPGGNWVAEARWSIAECRINLSQWRQAEDAYREYAQAYPQDPKAAEANRRMGVVKDLARFQALVDEKGQRKAFDAQHQIAQIVRTQLANPAKAIIEYRKVATNWPDSHLADDALFEVGSIYLSLDETGKGREALLLLAGKYPESPLADDALYQIGQSYEAESQRLAGVTRGRAAEKNKEIAQREAYQQVQEGRRNLRALNDALVAELRVKGQQADAEVAQARYAAQAMQFNFANTTVAAQAAEQQVEALTAAQLADRQDKINAALRKAVEAYQNAAKVPAADKADDALLLMAKIYDEKLKDSDAAMATWLEIVRQFSGTDVAEDASWRIAQFHERKREYAKAVEAYQAFLRNYRASARAAEAQFSVAENYEHLGEWVKAMDAYTNYINSFPNAPMVAKAREQINWIKTYRL